MRVSKKQNYADGEQLSWWSPRAKEQHGVDFWTSGAVLCVLDVVVVTQIYTCVPIHSTTQTRTQSSVQGKRTLEGNVLQERGWRVPWLWVGSWALGAGETGGRAPCV